MAKRKDKFDYILIETTGLADPSPVAQSFFVDDEIAGQYHLDGIITVVDAKHILPHLTEEKPQDVENESVEQIAFSDRVILNKIDLLSGDEELEKVKEEIRKVNAFVSITETTNSVIDLSYILNIRSFDLKKILTIDPNFLIDTQHSHDQSVSSVALVHEGLVVQAQFSKWLRGLLSEKGNDIFRSKGIVYSVEMQQQKDLMDMALVFQGVHMMMDMKVMAVPGSSTVNKLVFIGRNLNKEEIERGFKMCLYPTK